MLNLFQMDQYTQKYRDVWEKDHQFKKWLSYCKIEISALYTDLVRNGQTCEDSWEWCSAIVQTKLSFTSGEAASEVQNLKEYFRYL